MDSMNIGSGGDEENGGGDREEYSDACLGGYAIVVSYKPSS